MSHFQFLFFMYERKIRPLAIFVLVVRDTRDHPGLVTKNLSVRLIIHKLDIKAPLSWWLISRSRPPQGKLLPSHKNIYSLLETPSVTQQNFFRRIRSFSYARKLHPRGRLAELTWESLSRHSQKIAFTYYALFVGLLKKIPFT